MIVRDLALLALLSSALGSCSRPQPPQPAPAPTATIEVEPSRSEAVVDASPALDRNGLLSVDEPALVGRLVVNAPYSIMHPSEYCLDDKQIYTGAPARIGRLNVFARAPVGDLAGRIVLARGQHEPSLLAMLQRKEACPADYGSSPAEMPQMRSDWVSPEGGFKTTREKLASLQAFRARELRALDLGEKLESSADTVTVELRNPFAVPLDALETNAHYEGGPGKPMPLFRKVELALPAGDKQRLELPARIGAGPAGQIVGSPRGVYRLHSVELKGRLGKTDFDVSIFVGR